MIRKPLSFLLPFVFGFVTANADVAPAPGTVSAGQDLVLVAKEGISDHRFFLIALSGSTEEIRLESGGRTVISSKGKGGTWRRVRLFAVHSDKLEEGEIGKDDLDLLGHGLLEHTVEGVELLTHSFRIEIPWSSDGGTRQVVYRLSLDEAKGELSAERIGASPEDEAVPEKRSFIAPAVGMLLFGASAALGLIVIRRLGKQM